MMTKKLFFAASAFLMVTACTQEIVSDIQEQFAFKEGGATIAATINDEPATRVAVDQTGVDGKTTLKWEAGDRVLVASGQRGYTFKGNFAATDIDGDFAMFQEETGSTGTFDAMKLNEAYYPAAAWDYSGSDPVYTFPTEQVYLEGTFDRNAMPMVALSSDGNFAFSAVATVLRLNISTAIDDVKLDKITLTSKNHSLSGHAVLSYTDFLKPSSEVGSNNASLLCADVEIYSIAQSFYIVVPSGTYEAGDLILLFETSAGEYEKKSDKVFTLEVGKVYEMNLSIIPENKVNDLSENGTANCYIVSKYGPCKFDATKKGHTSESVGTIASAEVLWESFGNDVQPAVGDIVSNVKVKNGVVSFTASGKDGNAVIAVKDAAGEILWSWHIWVCQGFDSIATAQVYNNNAGIVMDRNLGATSAAKGNVRTLGLLYQWGRKDPFLSGQSINSSTPAKSTITWPSKVSSNSSDYGTIDYVVKHPTTFVTGNSRNGDWYNSTTVQTRWDSSKGMYDPCPNGWKVPDGGKNGLWGLTLGYSVFGTQGPWDATNKGMDFTGNLIAASNVWYPASGYTYNGTLNSVGVSGDYWSCTSSGSTGYYFTFKSSSYQQNNSEYKARAFSVRCVKQ